MTAAEFMRAAFPEHERWELVNGEPVLSPSPDLRHQLVTDEISRRLGNWLESNPIALKVVDWDIALLLDETRRPDILLTLKKGGRLKLGTHGHGSPDFVIEVLSPGQENRDLGDKKDLYERCGVQEYWVVDYRKRVVHQFLPEHDGRYRSKIVSRGSIRSRVLGGLAIRLKDIFAVLDQLP